MANEIQVQFGINVAKSVGGTLDLKQTIPFEVLLRSLSGSRAYSNTQAIGFAAHEALAVGADLTTRGYCFMRNMDATNYVQVGTVVNSSFAPGPQQLKAGDINIITLSTETLYAKANTGSVDLFFWILEQ